jgi:hypothetical protein
VSDDTTKPAARAAAVGAVQDVAVLAGAATFTYGAWLAWRPAGFMFAGLFLLVPAAIGALRARARPKDGGP